MTTVEETETAVLSDPIACANPTEKKENLCEAASENLCEEEPSKNLCGEEPSENLCGEAASENQNEGGPSENQSEGACETETCKDPKDGATDTEFAAMEGELLDFEDFGRDCDSKNNLDEDDKKLLEKGAEKEDGACSEGELNDNEDLEEGELREPSSLSDTREPARQVCRFFHRGVCYYGSACRFLHLTNNKKGNYSMFETTTTTTTRGASSGFPNQQHTQRERQPPRVPEFVETAPMPFSSEESAWEKGLREARNLLKEAHLKKRKDPNFDQKKLNISLCLNEKNIPPPETHNDERIDIEKGRERNFSSYTHKGGYDTHAFSENHHPHIYNERRDKGMDSRDNRHKRKLSVERRFPAHKGRNRNNTDIERPFFGDQYFDPWRRSKSPNHRERSHSSFSSYSSYSRSSSGSRSPASSRSSCRSSRRTSSSRSRSVSRNSSRSRSISLDSVSSGASSRNSTVSHSSSGSEHDIKEDLREKPVTNPDSAPLDNKFRGIGSLLNSKRDLLEEKFEDAPVEMDLRYLIPKIPEKKEPVRLALTHKNPIKLTLLNKFPQSKAGFSKDSKEFAVKKPDEPLKLNLLQGVKRPLSPSESAEPVKQTPVLLPKKSASSRRDDLLKQLKAVEEAIARKRAKF